MRYVKMQDFQPFVEGEQFVEFAPIIQVVGLVLLVTAVVLSSENPFTFAGYSIRLLPSFKFKKVFWPELIINSRQLLPVDFRYLETILTNGPTLHAAG